MLTDPYLPILKAVAAMPFVKLAAPKAFGARISQRSGVIAALGDDAGLSQKVSKVSFDP